MQQNGNGRLGRRSKVQGAKRRERGAAPRSWLRALAFGAALATSAAWGLEPNGEQITLNFKNADIRSVVELVSKVTGRNFVLDPRVKGNVTVVSNAPVPPEVVYETFLSILAVHGFSAMPDGGGLVRIVPDNAAVASAGFSEDLYADEVLGGEMRISVIPIRNVDAGQLVPLLRPLVDKNGHLVAHPQSNALIVADSARAIERLRRVIEVMDTVNDGDLSFFPLRYAVASKVVTTLQPLIAGAPKGGSNNQITLAADDRTNTLMVSGGEGPLLERLRLLIAHLDAPTDNAGDTRVIYLNYAKAADVAEVLRKLAEDMQKQSGGDKGGSPTVGIQADAGTNSLLITAKPDDMRALVSAVEAMDIRRAQVLVETLIVEITDDKARKLGIQWVAAQESLLNLTDAGALSSSALDLGTMIGRIGMGAGVNIGFLARALANDADANIISTPSLITMDNAEAEINVGSEVPFVTGSYTSTGDATNPSNPFTTIQRSNVGLTLKITPQINKGAVIRMDIDQEISGLLPGAAATFGATDVVTSVRSLKTSVLVEDGEMLVLGGLVDDTVRENQVRIPLFGDLPIFGPLFRYRETTKEKRNLLIFIRPRILRDAAASRSLSQRKYESIRAMQIEKRAEGVQLLSRQDAPVLNPLAPETVPAPVTPPPQPPATSQPPVSPLSAPAPAALAPPPPSEPPPPSVQAAPQMVREPVRPLTPAPQATVAPPVASKPPAPSQPRRIHLFPDELPYLDDRIRFVPEPKSEPEPVSLSVAPSRPTQPSRAARPAAPPIKVAPSVEDTAQPASAPTQTVSIEPEIALTPRATPAASTQPKPQPEPIALPQPSDLPPAPNWGPITPAPPKDRADATPSKNATNNEIELQPLSLSSQGTIAAPQPKRASPSLQPVVARAVTDSAADDANELELKPISPLPSRTLAAPSPDKTAGNGVASKPRQTDANAIELQPLAVFPTAPAATPATESVVPPAPAKVVRPFWEEPSAVIEAAQPKPRPATPTVETKSVAKPEATRAPEPTPATPQPQPNRKNENLFWDEPNSAPPPPMPSWLRNLLSSTAASTRDTDQS